jgi:predicted Fe-Mo cluster-binding NifX family protein
MEKGISMKIAISSNSGSPDQKFQSRFARCAYFAVFDQNQESWDSLKNPAVDSQGGAGPKVVQFLADNGIQTVISGRFGPHAFTALQAAGIEAYLAVQGSPEALVRAQQAGELTLASGASGPGRHGG